MRRRSLPGFPWARTCPRSMFDLPAFLSENVGTAGLGPSQPGPAFHLRDGRPPSAAADAAPKSPRLPGLPRPGGGGTNP